MGKVTGETVGSIHGRMFFAAVQQQSGIGVTEKSVNSRMVKAVPSMYSQLRDRAEALPSFWRHVHSVRYGAIAAAGATKLALESSARTSDYQRA